MVEETGKMADQKHRSIIELAIAGVPQATIQKIIAKYEGIWRYIADHEGQWRKRAEEEVIDKWHVRMSSADEQVLT